MRRRATRWMAVMAWLIMSLPAPPAYAWGPLRKLVRGSVNIATGWVEAPARVLWTTEVEGSIAGVSVGAVRGVALGIRRTLVGAYEIVTFLLPNYPMQGGGDPYRPIVEPTFVVLRPADKA